MKLSIIAVLVAMTLLPSTAAAASCPNGYVALTIDDGPSALTPQIVDKLVANGDHATFFDIGTNVAKFPDAARYTVNHDMQIGDHTYSHVDLPPLTDDQIKAQITDQATLVRNVTGFNETLAREPEGAGDTRVVSIIQGLGFIEALWTIDSMDDVEPDVNKIIANVRVGLKPNEVILMHDFGNAITLDILQGILNEIHAKGLCTGALIGSATPLPTKLPDGREVFLSIIPWPVPPPPPPPPTPAPPAPPVVVAAPAQVTQPDLRPVLALSFDEAADRIEAVFKKRFKSFRHASFKGIISYHKKSPTVRQIIVKWDYRRHHYRRVVTVTKRSTYLITVSIRLSRQHN